MTLYTYYKLDYYAFYQKFFLPADIILAVTALAAAYVRASRLKMRIMQEKYRNNIINSLAHDLKTPLSVVTGCAENLYSSVHTEKREYYAKAVMDNVGYANSIINRSLDYLKTEDKKIKPVMKICSIDDIISGILEKYEYKASERNLSFSVKGSMSVKGDRQLLEQMFDNLISNSIKYSAENSVVNISLNKEKAEISNECEILPCADPSTLTEPFVRGNAERKERDSTGLGLAIASNIAGMHNYKLSVNIKENRFVTVFSV